MRAFHAFVNGRGWIAAGAVSAAVAVAVGAFAAHALKGRLSADLLQVFETAVRYQMYHALGLLAVGLLRRREPWARRLLAIAGGAFVGGTLLFCGSLYGLALGGPREVAMLAPLGGVAFVAGWLCLAAAALRPPLSPDDDARSARPGRPY